MTDGNAIIFDDDERKDMRNKSLSNGKTRKDRLEYRTNQGKETMRTTSVWHWVIEEEKLDRSLSTRFFLVQFDYSLIINVC